MTIWIFQNTKDSDPYATRDTLDELTAKVRVNELNRLVNNIQLAVDNYVANEQLKIWLHLFFFSYTWLLCIILSASIDKLFVPICFYLE